MGSAGLEWDATDNPEKARLNQKTTFVGTGAQISGLSTTYAGQLAYCTSTGSGYTADTMYVRNAANSSWTDLHLITDNITETSESNTTPVTDDLDLTVTAGHRYYAFFTLPSTEPLYIITGIEWENGASVSGNIICGVDIVDANPPTVAGTALAAYGAEIAQSGTSVIQRNSNIISCPIRAGTICGAWVACSAATTIREDDGAGSGYKKAISYSTTLLPTEPTGFTSGIDPVYLKVYYRGYY